MHSKNGSQYDRTEEYGEYILSRTVKSVHRTYFLDVRATKGEDFFVTITESRKRQNPDGTQFYDRHKLVLYKEDMRRFCEEFAIIEKFLQENRPQYFEQTDSVDIPAKTEDVRPEENYEFTTDTEPSVESDVKFEDL